MAGLCGVSPEYPLHGSSHPDTGGKEVREGGREGGRKGGREGREGEREGRREGVGLDTPTNVLIYLCSEVLHPGQSQLTEVSMLHP